MLQQRSDGQGINIRDIKTQSARELHSDLTVAVYVDGVYTVDTYGLAPNLFDVERVEVARGRRGTFNGRNSIAGSSSYHTRKPTAERDTIVLPDDFHDTNCVPIPRDHPSDELRQMPNHKLAITTAYQIQLAERGSLLRFGTWSDTGARWQHSKE